MNEKIYFHCTEKWRLLRFLINTLLYSATEVNGGAANPRSKITV